MAAYTWIKLYIEMLDDPKVGMMPDWAKWKFVQFLLVARENNRDGLLGPVCDLAWRLRSSEDDVLNALRTMSEPGLVAETPDGWIVVNFKKRQARIEGVDRTRSYRDRLRDDGVTKRHESCDEAASHSSSSTSSSVSLEEGVQGGKPIPETPLEADRDPDITIFTEASGRIPGMPQYKAVIETVQFIRKARNLTYETTITYLRPFWLAWSSRKRKDGKPYDPGNITWLTEWAVNGSVPSERGDPIENPNSPYDIQQARLERSWNSLAEYVETKEKNNATN